MDSESGIFLNNGVFLLNARKDEVLLIATTSLSKIYRISHDGKFFLFKTSFDQTERGKAIIRREYELSLGCDHPHIAHIFLYEKATTLGEGILLEYIEGRNLNEYLAENPSPKSKERIFTELLDAVSYLHKKGIVHNDLKPENILISRRDDSLKLIDFGLSDDDAHFMVKTPGCSPAFAAPELKDKRQSDVRSDIYSLGKIMRIVFGNRYELISSKCFRDNPDKRYQNIDSLKKSWKKRDKIRKVLFLGIPLLVIFLFILVFLFQVKNHNEEMESSLTDQYIVIENQKKEIKDLQSAYKLVKDSLEYVTVQAKLFDRLKKERIESFSQGFDRRFKISSDSILKSQNSYEIAAIGSNFVKNATIYYDNFDKIVEGKDISAEIYPVFILKLEKSNAFFQKEMLKMINQYLP